MAEVLAENTDISCPSGGVYRAPDDNTVECSVHGKDSALSAAGDKAGGELVEIPEEESALPTEMCIRDRWKGMWRTGFFSAEAMPADRIKSKRWKISWARLRML